MPWITVMNSNMAQGLVMHTGHNGARYKNLPNSYVFLYAGIN